MANYPTAHSCQGYEILLRPYSWYVFGMSLEYIWKPSLSRVSVAITEKSSPAIARMVLQIQGMRWYTFKHGLYLEYVSADFNWY